MYRRHSPVGVPGPGVGNNDVQSNIPQQVAGGNQGLPINHGPSVAGQHQPPGVQHSQDAAPPYALHSPNMHNPQHNNITSPKMQQQNVQTKTSVLRQFRKTDFIQETSNGTKLIQPNQNQPYQIASSKQEEYQQQTNQQNQQQDCVPKINNQNNNQLVPNNHNNSENLIINNSENIVFNAYGVNQSSNRTNNNYYQQENGQKSPCFAENFQQRPILNHSEKMCNNYWPNQQGINTPLPENYDSKNYTNIIKNPQDYRYNYCQQKKSSVIDQNYYLKNCENRAASVQNYQNSLDRRISPVNQNFVPPKTEYGNLYLEKHESYPKNNLDLRYPQYHQNYQKVAPIPKKPNFTILEQRLTNQAYGEVADYMHSKFPVIQNKGSPNPRPNQFVPGKNIPLEQNKFADWPYPREFRDNRYFSDIAQLDPRVAQGIIQHHNSIKNYEMPRDRLMENLRIPFNQNKLPYQNQIRPMNSIRPNYVQEIPRQVEENKFLRKDFGNSCKVEGFRDIPGREEMYINSQVRGGYLPSRNGVPENPQRNISPRSTFQENMHTIVIPSQVIQNFNQNDFYNQNYFNKEYNPNFTELQRAQNVPRPFPNSRLGYPEIYPQDYNRGFRPEFQDSRNIEQGTRKPYDPGKESEVSKLNLKEFFENWEDDEEIVANLPDLIPCNNVIERNMSVDSNYVSESSNDKTSYEEVRSVENLYVLEKQNISPEMLSKFQHLTPVEKIPDNIKDFIKISEDTATKRGADQVLNLSVTKEENNNILADNKPEVMPKSENHKSVIVSNIKFDSQEPQNSAEKTPVPFRSPENLELSLTIPFKSNSSYQTENVNRLLEYVNNNTNIELEKGNIQIGQVNLGKEDIPTKENPGSEDKEVPLEHRHIKSKGELKSYIQDKSNSPNQESSPQSCENSPQNSEQVIEEKTVRHENGLKQPRSPKCTRDENELRTNQKNHECSTVQSSKDQDLNSPNPIKENVPHPNTLIDQNIPIQSKGDLESSGKGETKVLLNSNKDKFPDSDIPKQHLDTIEEITKEVNQKRSIIVENTDPVIITEDITKSEDQVTTGRQNVIENKLVQENQNEGLLKKKDLHDSETNKNAEIELETLDDGTTTTTKICEENAKKEDVIFEDKKELINNDYIENTNLINEKNQIKEDKMELMENDHIDGTNLIIDKATKTVDQTPTNEPQEDVIKTIKEKLLSTEVNSVEKQSPSKVDQECPKRLLNLLEDSIDNQKCLEDDSSDESIRKNQHHKELEENIIMTPKFSTQDSPTSEEQFKNSSSITSDSNSDLSNDVGYRHLGPKTPLTPESEHFEEDIQHSSSEEVVTSSVSEDQKQNCSYSESEEQETTDNKFGIKDFTNQLDESQIDVDEVEVLVSNEIQVDKASNLDYLVENCPLKNSGIEASQLEVPIACVKGTKTYVDMAVQTSFDSPCGINGKKQCCIYQKLFFNRRKLFLIGQVKRKNTKQVLSRTKIKRLKRRAKEVKRIMSKNRNLDKNISKNREGEHGPSSVEEEDKMGAFINPEAPDDSCVLKPKPEIQTSKDEVAKTHSDSSLTDGLKLNIPSTRKISIVTDGVPNVEDSITDNILHFPKRRISETTLPKDLISEEKTESLTDKLPISLKRKSFEKGRKHFIPIDEISKNVLDAMNTLSDTSESRRSNDSSFEDRELSQSSSEEDTSFKLYHSSSSKENYSDKTFFFLERQNAVFGPIPENVFEKSSFTESVTTNNQKEILKELLDSDKVPKANEDLIVDTYEKVSPKVESLLPLFDSKLKTEDLNSQIQPQNLNLESGLPILPEISSKLGLETPNINPIDGESNTPSCVDEEREPLLSEATSLISKCPIVSQESTKTNTRSQVTGFIPGPLHSNFQETSNPLQSEIEGVRSPNPPEDIVKQTMEEIPKTQLDQEVSNSVNLDITANLELNPQPDVEEIHSSQNQETRENLKSTSLSLLAQEVHLSKPEASKDVILEKEMPPKLDLEVEGADNFQKQGPDLDPPHLEFEIQTSFVPLQPSEDRLTHHEHLSEILENDSTNIEIICNEQDMKNYNFDEGILHNSPVSEVYYEEYIIENTGSYEDILISSDQTIIVTPDECSNDILKERSEESSEILLEQPGGDEILIENGVENIFQEVIIEDGNCSMEEKDDLFKLEENPLTLEDPLASTELTPPPEFTSRDEFIVKRPFSQITNGFFKIAPFDLDIKKSLQLSNLTRKPLNGVNSKPKKINLSDYRKRKLNQSQSVSLNEDKNNSTAETIEKNILEMAQEERIGFPKPNIDTRNEKLYHKEQKCHKESSIPKEKSSSFNSIDSKEETNLKQYLSPKEHSSLKEITSFMKRDPRLRGEQKPNQEELTKGPKETSSSREDQTSSKEGLVPQKFLRLASKERRCSFNKKGALDKRKDTPHKANMSSNFYVRNDRKVVKLTINKNKIKADKFEAPKEETTHPKDHNLNNHRVIESKDLFKQEEKGNTIIGSKELPKKPSKSLKKMYLLEAENDKNMLFLNPLVLKRSNPDEDLLKNGAKRLKQKGFTKDQQSCSKSENIKPKRRVSEGTNPIDKGGNIFSEERRKSTDLVIEKPNKSFVVPEEPKIEPLKNDSTNKDLIPVKRKRKKKRFRNLYTLSDSDDEVVNNLAQINTNTELTNSGLQNAGIKVKIPRNCFEKADENFKFLITKEKDMVPKVLIKKNGTTYVSSFMKNIKEPFWQPRVLLKRYPTSEILKITKNKI